MDKLSLIKYLNGEKFVKSFSKEIAIELSLFKKSISIKGKTVNIFLKNDSNDLMVNYNYLKKICTDFINNEVDVYFLSYISDALLLSNHSVFQNENLKEMFETLTDFEDERIIKEYVKSVFLIEIENQQLLIKDGK